MNKLLRPNELSLNIKKELKDLSRDSNYKLRYYRDREFDPYDFPTGRLYPTLREIKIFKWNKKDIRCYFAGLHEFGHVFLQHDPSLRQEPIIEKEQEFEAWKWAISNRKIEITEPVIEQITISLRSYALPEPQIQSLLIPATITPNAL